MAKNCKCLSNSEKWLVSFYTALVFMLVASPFMYKVTGGLTRMVGLETSDSDGCPNVYGVLLHGVVFLLLVRILMMIPHKEDKDS
jgi:hypothetical protein